MRILVDMDDVLAGFDERFLELWREKYPDKFYVPLEERNTFFIIDQYPEELHAFVKQIYLSPGFCHSLTPMQGGLEAITEMQSKGHEVFICTAPLMPYHNCVLEKYQWVEKHFGMDWVRKIILTKDKTIVAGDILIDDKPDVTGIAVPSWEHVLYDRPYNRHVNKRRLTWKNWREVLGL